MCHLAAVKNFYRCLNDLGILSLDIFCKLEFRNILFFWIPAFAGMTEILNTKNRRICAASTNMVRPTHYRKATPATGRETYSTEATGTMPRLAACAVRLLTVSASVS